MVKEILVPVCGSSSSVKIRGANLAFMIGSYLEKLVTNCPTNHQGFWDKWKAGYQSSASEFQLYLTNTGCILVGGSLFVGFAYDQGALCGVFGSYLGEVKCYQCPIPIKDPSKDYERAMELYDQLIEISTIRS